MQRTLQFILKSLLILGRIVPPTLAMILLAQKQDFFLHFSQVFRVFVSLGLLTLPVFLLLMQGALAYELPDSLLLLSRRLATKLLLVLPYFLAWIYGAPWSILGLLLAWSLVEFLTLMGAFFMGISKGLAPMNLSRTELLLIYPINAILFIFPAMLWSYVFFEQNTSLFLQDFWSQLLFCLFALPAILSGAKREHKIIFDLV